MMCVSGRKIERNVTGNSGQALFTGLKGKIWRPAPISGGWPEEGKPLHPQLRRRLVSPEDRTNANRARKKTGSPEIFRTAG